jgi:hypothetical protein
VEVAHDDVGALVGELPEDLPAGAGGLLVVVVADVDDVGSAT